MKLARVFRSARWVSQAVWLRVGVIDSKLTPLIVVSSVLLGLFAVIMLPREEEPQIKVPMIDVLVSMPGFSAKEVEERATRPMEKLLWEIPGAGVTSTPPRARARASSSYVSWSAKTSNAALCG